MDTLPTWRPDLLAEDAEELVAGGIHQAGLEVFTLSLETELRYAFDTLRVSKPDQAAVFDQARYDARAIDPHASVFRVRLRAALMIRQCIRDWCARQTTV